MDALYDKHCVVLPCQQAIVESGAPVVEKWSTLLKHTPYLTAVASFLFSIPITNSSVERVFSRMTACWTDHRNCCSVELMKSEVKSNFRFKEFYAYALKERALLEAACSDKKYKVRKNL